MCFSLEVFVENQLTLTVVGWRLGAEARIRQQVRRDRLNEEHEVLVQGGHVADPVDAFWRTAMSQSTSTTNVRCTNLGIGPDV